MKNSLLRPTLLLFAVLTAGTILSGCCHSEVFTDPVKVQKAERGELVPAATGTARNFGYYLFNTWPIYTGHAGKYNRHDYHTFHDDITPERNSAMLLDAMKKLYGVQELAEVEHSQSSFGFFSLWIIWRKNITTTAVGLKPYCKK